MASRSLNDLTPDTKIKALEFLRLTSDADLQVLIYCTHRDAWEQARLYRQSRTRKEIDQKRDFLIKNGYRVLADILEAVGPQAGALPHVTWAGPGESFHQFRQAFDAVPVIDGKCIWIDDHPSWLTFAAGANQAGLDWSGYWPKAKREYFHCQIPTAARENPLFHYNPVEIGKALAADIDRLNDDKEAA